MYVVATYVWCQNGVVRTSTSVKQRFVGSAAEVGRIVVGSARGAAPSDVTQVNLVTWTANVLGAVDIAAVPRGVLTRAGQGTQQTDSKQRLDLFTWCVRLSRL